MKNHFVKSATISVGVIAPIMGILGLIDSIERKSLLRIS
jgi:hypothetical protein